MLIHERSTIRQKTRRPWLLLLTLILAAGLLAGCAQVRTGTPPTISAFTADPLSITSGDSSTLSWDVAGADKIVLNPGNMQVNAKGSAQVKPDATTTYTLTASNKRGSATASVQIRVRAATDPPLISQFEVEPQSIVRGAESLLSWSVAGADRVLITPEPGEMAASGSSAVAPEETTLYTLTATNSYGTSNLQVLLTVTDPDGDGDDKPDRPFIASFTAGPEAIDAGQGSTLSWNVSGAATVSISPGPGNVPASGNLSVSPSETTTYTLTATGPTGATATRTATVSVRQNPDTSAPLIGRFTANPSQIAAGGSSVLSWAVTGASSVSISGGVGTVAASGSSSVSPEADTTYTLTASNAHGTVTANATIRVSDDGTNGDLLPPVIAAFLAEPSSGDAPLDTTLRWVILGSPATFASADLDFGDGTLLTDMTQLTSAATHTFAAGIHQAVLTVHHTDGSSSVKSATVTVSAASTAPPAITELTLTPQSGQAPLDVTATWNAAGSGLTCEINFGDGSTPAAPGSCAAGSVAHQYDEPGVYTVTLAVVNADGGATQESREVTVLPAGGLDPRISSFTADPGSGAAPLDVQFTWSATSASGTPHTTWLFAGDGSAPRSGGSPVSHTYQDAGQYDAVLVAVNNDGGYDLKRQRISVAAAGPGDAGNPLAMISAGPSLATLDSTQSDTLNMLLGSLLGEELQLQAVDYNGIAALDLDLLDFLGTGVGAATPAQGLATNLTIGELIDFLATAADGDTATLAAIDKLTPLTLPTTQFQLGDLLNFDLNDAMLGSAKLNALELLVGSIQLMDHKNLASTPDRITIDLEPLLGGAGAGPKVHIRARVIEAPTIIYAGVDNIGKPEAEFRSAAVRLALEFEGLNVALGASDTDASPGSFLGGITDLVKGLLGLLLSVDVGLELEVANLGVYADVAAVNGLLKSLDVTSPNVLLAATPGIANLFIGEIADSVFFSSGPISDSDVRGGRIGTAVLSLRACLVVCIVPIEGSLDAGITATAVARGASTAAADLSFGGPFPQSRAVSAGAGGASALIHSLLDSLSIEVVADTTDMDVIGIPVGDLLDSLLPPVTNLVNGIFKGVADAPATFPLESLLGSLLDPLLYLLGIGLGDGEVTVHELIHTP